MWVQGAKRLRMAVLADPAIAIAGIIRLHLLLAIELKYCRGAESYCVLFDVFPSL